MARQRDDSFSNTVIRRILHTLLESGELSKSHVCNKCDLNFKVCTKYIKLLSRIQWIETTRKDGHDLIRISQQGIVSLRNLEDDIPHYRQTTVDRSLDGNESLKLTKGTEDSLHDSQMLNIKQDVHIKKQKSEQINLRMTKRVVIIDDDENSLFTYGLILKNIPHLNVKTFADPKMAFKYLTQHIETIPLVILDIRMPGMSGLRMFEGIKVVNPALHVIFLSSLDAGPELTEMYSDLSDRVRFLRKPVGRDKFLAAVKEALV